MKNTLLHITLFFFVLTGSAIAETKSITLKDGSMIKGNVVEMKNGVYTIETENLGKIKLNESKIVSIGGAKSQNVSASIGDALNSSSSINTTQLMQQAQQMQASLLADPKMFGELQGLMNDPAIQEILSDPALMQDIMSYDPQRIMANPKLSALMNNPQIQKMIKQLQGSGFSLAPAGN